MTKSKYETHVLPYLDKITAWAEAGATEKEIADKLHIAGSTFRRYLDNGEKGDERYSALSSAFTRACEEPDNEVEAALYKRACGYRYTSVTEEEKMDRDGTVHTLKKTVVKDVPPDPTSAMFWLTNRRGDRWKYKPEPVDNEGGDGSGVVQLPAVMEPAQPPEIPEDEASEEDGGSEDG